jgi:hypothetical protein
MVFLSEIYGWQCVEELKQCNVGGRRDKNVVEHVGIIELVAMISGKKPYRVAYGPGGKEEGRSAWLARHSRVVAVQ